MTRKVIVTGATPGSIGFATACRLAELGDDVTVTSRSGVHGRPLNLTDARSVTGFATWYAEHSDGRLDVLVNNAGVHLDLCSTWREPHCTADGFEVHWRTNYLGTMQLTHLLLPLLEETGRRTGDARVVNVVSKTARPRPQSVPVRTARALQVVGRLRPVQIGPDPCRHRTQPPLCRVIGSGVLGASGFGVHAHRRPRARGSSAARGGPSAPRPDRAPEPQEPGRGGPNLGALR